MTKIYCNHNIVEPSTPGKQSRARHELITLLCLFPSHSLYEYYEFLYESSSSQYTLTGVRKVMNAFLRYDFVTRSRGKGKVLGKDGISIVTGSCYVFQLSSSGLQLAETYLCQRRTFFNRIEYEVSKTNLSPVSNFFYQRMRGY